MGLLDIVHPAAKTLVDIARSQDAEIGDGTTTVVLLACEFLKAAKPFVEDGVHPQVIVRAFRRAGILARDRLKALSVGFDEFDDSMPVEDTPRYAAMLKCAKTSLNSKLISRYQDFFGPMVVQAILSLGDDLDLNMVGIKLVPGGSVTDSFYVDGVAFKRTFSYAGFEQQPKRFADPKILLLNLELELKSEKENAEIRIEDPDMYQSMVDAEWDIIYEKLALCVKSGAQIILSRLPIGDLATQYFADRGLFCAGRVGADDVRRVALATGAKVQTTVHGVDSSVLGTCGRFEERQVGAERYNLFMDCPSARTASIVLRGGAEQFLAESERSLHDSLMITKNCVKSSRVVAGGGAIEMAISRYIKEEALEVAGKEQLIMRAFAQALEIIPRQLADNAGFDSTDILNQLRHKHAAGVEGRWYGVDIDSESVCDTMVSGVLEPVASKLNSFSSANEAACLILSVDETVTNPQSEQAGGGAGAGRGRGGRGIGRGAPMSAALGGGGMRGMVGGGRGRGIRAYRGRGGK